MLWTCSFQVYWNVLHVALSRAACVAGAPLWEILSAGDWSSPAFMDYLDKWRLERDVVMQAHLDESDCEAEG